MCNRVLLSHLILHIRYDALATIPCASTFADPLNDEESCRNYATFTEDTARWRIESWLHECSVSCESRLRALSIAGAQQCECNFLS